MANLILPRRFTQQPQYPARVDQSNPLVSGSKSLLNPGGGVLFDAVAGIPPAVSAFGTAPVYAAGGHGIALQSAADGGLIYSNTAAFSSYAYSVTIVLELTSVDPSYGGLFSVSNGDTTARFGLQRNAGANDWAVFHDNATGVSVGGASAITNLIGSGKHVITIAHNGVAGGPLRYWLDGALITDTTHSVAPSIPSSPRLVLFGERTANVNYSSGGKIYAVDVKDRLLSTGEVQEIHRNFWQLFRRRPQVLYFDVGGGAQTLTPSLVTDSDTFHAATVTAGAVTLTPSLVTDADTFYAATVSQGAQELTPALFADTDTFYAATVAAGVATLTPVLFADTDTLYAATVTPGAVTLTPSLYADADTFHAAEVAAGYNLQPPAFADSDAFHAATVTPGAASLTPALFVDGDTFYSPSVSGGAQSLTPALYTNSSEFYAATVTDLSWQVVSDASGSWSDVAANSDGWSIVANASGSWTVQ